MAGRRVNSRRIVPISAQGFGRFGSADDDDDVRGNGDDDDDEHHAFEKQMLLDLDDFQDGISTHQSPRSAAIAKAEEDAAIAAGGSYDDEPEEEVVLSHDVPGAGIKQIEAMHEAFKLMQKQVEEYKKRTAGKSLRHYIGIASSITDVFTQI